MHATPVAEANDALRAYLHAHGSRAWTPAELAELERLRSTFLAAQRAHYSKAA